MCGVYRYGEKYGGREGVCVCVRGVYRYGEKYRGGRVCVCVVCIGMVKSMGGGRVCVCVVCV